MIILTTTTHKGRNKRALCVVHLRTSYQREGDLHQAEHNVFHSDKPRDEKDLEKIVLQNFTVSKISPP